MENFRSRILSDARELMLGEQQHESSMKSWNGPETKGFEVVFEGVKRGIPTVSGVIGQIFITQDGDFEALITGYVVKNGLRSIVSTFSVTPSAHLSSEVHNGLSSLSIAVTSSLTVAHILTLPNCRDRILKVLNGKEAARLAQVNKGIKDSVTSVEVDRTFWKDKLKSDFSAEKVQQAITASRRFYKAYGEAQIEKRAQESQNLRARQDVHDPLRDPLGVPTHFQQPGRAPWYNPDTEFYNPAGGFLPPGARPNNPGFPDLMGPGGPRGDPDLNPLAGGFNQNVFGGPPGGRRPGDPFRRQGGGFDGFNGGSGFF